MPGLSTTERPPPCRSPEEREHALDVGRVMLAVGVHENQDFAGGNPDAALTAAPLPML